MGDSLDAGMRSAIGTSGGCSATGSSHDGATSEHREPAVDPASGLESTLPPKPRVEDSHASEASRLRSLAGMIANKCRMAGDDYAVMADEAMEIAARIEQLGRVEEKKARMAQLYADARQILKELRAQVRHGIDAAQVSSIADGLERALVESEAK